MPPHEHQLSFPYVLVHWGAVPANRQNPAAMPTASEHSKEGKRLHATQLFFRCPDVGDDFLLRVSCYSCI